MKRSSVRLIVRSEKVPVRVENVRIPYPNATNPSLNVAKRVVMYEYVLDQSQRKALDNISRLAQLSGTHLEVVDLTHESVGKKLLRKLSAFVEKTPLLILGRESGPIVRPFFCEGIGCE